MLSVSGICMLLCQNFAMLFKSALIIVTLCITSGIWITSIEIVCFYLFAWTIIWCTQCSLSIKFIGLNVPIKHKHTNYYQSCDHILTFHLCGQCYLVLCRGRSRSLLILAWWAASPIPAAQQRRAGSLSPLSLPSTSGEKTLWLVKEPWCGKVWLSKDDNTGRVFTALV